MKNRPIKLKTINIYNFSIFNASDLAGSFLFICNVYKATLKAKKIKKQCLNKKKIFPKKNQ